MTDDRTKLLSIDPGKMTGLAYADVSDMSSPVIDWTDEKGMEDYFKFIEEFLVENKDDCSVVMEAFIITAKTGKLSQQPWSLELIGLTRYLCWKLDIPFSLQKPAEKHFADDKKLKKIGWHHVGGAGHADDALRHVIVWVTNRHPQFAKVFLK